VRKVAVAKKYVRHDDIVLHIGFLLFQILSAVLNCYRQPIVQLHPKTLCSCFDRDRIDIRTFYNSFRK
jgi:hypothetical protein